MSKGNSLVIVLEGFYTIVFSAIIVAQNAEVESKKQEIEESFQEYSDMKGKIYEDLLNEFQHDVGRWNAVLSKEDLSIKFFMDENSPKVMFKPGMGRQTDYYNDLIQDFCPRYYSVINPMIDSSLITEIKVEGHTSSEWTGGGEDGDTYYLNLGLSQDRAKNVMESCLRSIEAGIGSEYIPFRKKMTASGVAFSKIILDSSGFENAGASRRVEFKIITSFDDNLKSIK